MFRDSLLESALGSRRRKRWPMLLAVLLEVTAGAALLAIPLFSTGIIPVDARTVIVAPRLDQPAHAPDRPPDGGRRGTGQPNSNPTRPTLMTFNQGTRVIGRGQPNPTDGRDGGFNLGLGGERGGCTVCIEPPKPRAPQGPVRRSVISEGELLHRVEPVYPRMLAIIHTSGEVKLHAIIARDGSIQSLSVISGHPLLASAAMDAVRQWRYRPYFLNGEPVEVETFITVNFRSIH